MSTGTRKHYIDNLRWITLLILIPYHAAQAWNVWGEPNYITLEGNRALSSIIVFFSPFFMPVLFVLAGISTVYALRRRTVGQYLIERVKRLFVPFLFGTLTLMPVMTWLAHRFNYSYEGGFLEHYSVFFTKFTDLIGADGGFSMGQFWFLLYLLIISVVCVGVMALLKIKRKEDRVVPFWLVLLLGLPLPLLNDVLSISGKSFAEYAYLFLLGYFVLSRDDVVSKLEKYRLPLLACGLVCSALNVYLFIWSGRELPVLNTAAKFVSEWLMLLALMGMAKLHLNFTGEISGYMSSRSFLFYIYHFIWVVVFQYLLYPVCSGTGALFFASVVLAYIATFVCCEISIRIPALRTLTGVKKPAK